MRWRRVSDWRFGGDVVEPRQEDLQAISDHRGVMTPGPRDEFCGEPRPYKAVVAAAGLVDQVQQQLVAERHVAARPQDAFIDDLPEEVQRLRIGPAQPGLLQFGSEFVASFRHRAFHR